LAFAKLKIGIYETEYKFPAEAKSDTYPYCDEQKRLLERINETKQQEATIESLRPIVGTLELKKQRGTITEEEERQLTLLTKELGVRKEIMELKPYYIGQNGDVRFTALKLVGDEAIEKSNRTTVIPEGKFKFTEKGELDKIKPLRRISGYMLSDQLYKDMKAKGENTAIKFVAKFGSGITNEMRTYVFPTDVEGVLEMVKVSKERLYESMNTELEELKQRKELKKMLDEANLRASQDSMGKIAGDLDS